MVEVIRYPDVRLPSVSLRQILDKLLPSEGSFLREKRVGKAALAGVVVPATAVSGLFYGSKVVEGAMYTGVNKTPIEQTGEQASNGGLSDLTTAAGIILQPNKHLIRPLSQFPQEQPQK